MKPNHLAALTNALGGPGLGHIRVGHRARGCLFLVPALLCLGWLLYSQFLPVIVRQYHYASSVLVLSDLLPMASRMSRELHAAVFQLSTPMSILALLWLGAIVDAFFLPPKAAPD
jgi:hypothetical protein